MKNRGMCPSDTLRVVVLDGMLRNANGTPEHAIDPVLGRS